MAEMSIKKTHYRVSKQNEGFLITSLDAFHRMRQLASLGKYGLQSVAAIAPLFRLCLPSCGLGFESQAYHL